MTGEEGHRSDIPLSIVLLIYISIFLRLLPMNIFPDFHFLRLHENFLLPLLPPKGA